MKEMVAFSFINLIYLYMAEYPNGKELVLKTSDA